MVGLHRAGLEVVNQAFGGEDTIPVLQLTLPSAKISPVDWSSRPRSAMTKARSPCSSNVMRNRSLG
ncbi:MAG: hypothetical protein CM1200mP34_5680 [Verrucomicrobiales bacterium]|nr:MAG: hypothetical protein CM1200mP34_5680 [Verrucomicrobiales bacterium]